MIGSEVAMVVWTLLDTTAVPPIAAWGRFTALSVAAAVYALATTVPKDRRRTVVLTTSARHVDQSSAFLFAAGVVLPASLAILHLIIVRLLRYPAARQPRGRFCFTSAAIGVSMLGAHAVTADPRFAEWLAAPDTAPGGTAGAVRVLAAGAAAIALYYCTHTVMTSIDRLLEDKAAGRATTWSAMLGSRAERLDIVRVVGLACCVVVGLAPLHGVLVILVVAPLIVGDTQREHRFHAAAQAAGTNDVTGLPNEVRWRTEAMVAIQRARATGQRCTVAVLDLDHFKQVNDRFGHSVGDDVLRAVAHVLRQPFTDVPDSAFLIREGDVSAHLHGEEFAVLLPDTSAEVGREVMDRVRQAIQNLVITTAPDEDGRETVVAVTVSIGIAELTDVGSAEDALSRAFVEADTALLHMAKRSRNAVAIWSADHVTLGLGVGADA